MSGLLLKWFLLWELSLFDTPQGYVSELKASACNVGDPGSTPGLGRSLGEGNGNPHQYCLKNPMDGRAWQATVHGVSKSWTRLSDLASLLQGQFSGSLGSWGQCSHTKGSGFDHIGCHQLTHPVLQSELTGEGKFFSCCGKPLWLGCLVQSDVAEKIRFRFVSPWLSSLNFVLQFSHL